MAESASGDLAAALDDFNKALALDPSNGEALFGHGVVQLKQGNKDAAQKDFDMAVAAQPDLKDKVADELKNAAGGPTTAGRTTETK
jgi:Flp pilus assembly protein TadD